MIDTAQLATRLLLEPTGLDQRDLDRTFSHLLHHGADDADMYFQVVRQATWSLEDGQVKTGSYHEDKGVGVRVLSGEQTGFAYSDELVPEALLSAARMARSIAASGRAAGQPVPQLGVSRAVPVLYGTEDPLQWDAARIIAMMQQADRLARATDPRIQQVFVSASGVHEAVLVLTPDGRQVADVRPLVRLSVTAIAEQHGRREMGASGGGGRHGYAWFLESDRLEGYVREACRQALLNLEAVPAPAGVFPVVLGPGWPGVLLHEAVGHGLEGDFNRKGTSVFSGRIGDKVASPLCTVVDDGTLPGRRGSLQVDDEGTPTQCNVLIERGILKGYLQDKLNGRLMGGSSTGNGRRESYAACPMPRMTNTYLLPGEHAPEAIIQSVRKGLYAVNFGGGQVDITSGQFVFSASEAYLIEDGAIGPPVKGATLIGRGADVMQHISMVGHDLQLDTGVGTCGKEGQSVPVGVGQPTLKVDQLTVGGTAT